LEFDTTISPHRPNAQPKSGILKTPSPTSNTQINKTQKNKAADWF